jgi:hypothetical protein
MAATVQLLSYHDATGSTTANVAGTNICFKLADNDTVDTAAPVTIPTSGTNRSYVKQLRLNVSAWNTGTTTINNPKVYSGSNTIGSGIDIGYAFSATYLDPTSTGNGATALSPRTGSIIGTDSAPLTIPGTGTISSPSTGVFTQYLRLQMEVVSGATQGTSPVQTLSFSYDEF